MTSSFKASGIHILVIFLFRHSFGLPFLCFI